MHHGVSRLEDITAGGDFLGLCDQKSSYKHASLPVLLFYRVILSCKHLLRKLIHAVYFLYYFLLELSLNTV